MESKPYFNTFIQKSNSIFKTTIIKKYPNFIIWSSKSPDEFFDNSICQINESTNFKSNEKENINNNEGRTNLSNIEENKFKQELDNIIKKKEEEKLEESKELEIEIKNEEKDNEEKLFGRKKANSTKKGKHNKYSDDNLVRKCKHLLLDTIMKFINKRIKEIYNGDIGQGMLIKKLFTLNHGQKSNSIAQFNKELLYKTFREIYSDNISTRYTNFPENHNKRLIEKLINDEDEEKRNYFYNLFNLNLIQGLNHIIGEERIEELNGIESIDQILNNYYNDPDYKECLKYYLINFGNIINKKRSRKKRDKK